MISIPKHLTKIISKSAVRAMPELVEKITITAEKGKDWEYVCPSSISIFNKFKKQGSFGFASCQEMAQSIKDHLLPEENDIIKSIELSQAGKGEASKSGFFLNIHLKHEFIES